MYILWLVEFRAPGRSAQSRDKQKAQCETLAFYQEKTSSEKRCSSCELLGATEDTLKVY